jgi:hypothetical protein
MHESPRQPNVVEAWRAFQGCNAGTPAGVAPTSLLLVPVLLSVMLTGFPGVMRGVRVMPVSYVGMVTRRFVISLFMFLGGGKVVLGRVLMVFGRLAMVIDCVFGHGISSLRDYLRDCYLLVGIR